MSRRPDGALENDIMRVLWRAERPLQPAEVNELLGQGLAYTTVATVLGRLTAKGLAERTAGRRIAEVLDGTPDRREALSWFVGGLSAKDARALRGLLDGLDEA